MGGGPIPQARPRGTLLYDAIYLASQEKLKHEVGRKAMIIFTDGDDEGSQTSLGQAIEAAQKADAIVYVLLVYDPRYINGDREMRRLCQETGGRVILVGTKPDKLKKALQEVSDELRSQYYIGYTPTTEKPTGRSARWKSTPKPRITRCRRARAITRPGNNASECAALPLRRVIPAAGADAQSFSAGLDRDGVEAAVGDELRRLVGQRVLAAKFVLDLA